MKTKNSKLYNLVLTAILMGVVILLQLFASAIPIGTTNISLVLIPIVMGAMLCGPKSGAILGFTFGAVVLIGGISGTDPFTNLLINHHPVITTLLCLGKGTAAGWGAGVLYSLISKKSSVAATFAASAVAPIINTGLFILGGLFMSGTITDNFVADGQSLMYFLIIVCAGLNFIVELTVNTVFAPALAYVARLFEKSSAQVR